MQSCGDYKKKNPYLGHKIFKISLNPNNSCQFINEVKGGVFKDLEIGDRLPRFKRWLNKYLQACFRQSGIHYIFHIEVSTPIGSSFDKKNYIGPRLHAHGIIYMSDNKQLREWLIEVYPRLLSNCRIDIDTMDDLNVWKSYISKDNDWMRCDPLCSIIPETFWSYTERLWTTDIKQSEL